MKWFAKRKEKKKFQTWTKGYDWAAGALLRGDETPVSIEAYTNCCDRDSFDLGAEAATKDLLSLIVIESQKLKRHEDNHYVANYADVSPPE
ncbi:MAG: hypothetical protein DRH26_00530 [Deltaproteobacteria bacterium]|nr:MAG: hypothetical protein DRH26_00530 [Deltaproteobacteria bacterium]